MGHRQTIRRAIGDDSDVLIGYKKYHGFRARREQTLKGLQESVSVSLKRHRSGMATFLDVLDSLRSLFNVEFGLTQARNKEYKSLAQFYKSHCDGRSNHPQLAPIVPNLKRIRA
jgi:outer membrane protein TolC